MKFLTLLILVLVFVKSSIAGLTITPQNIVIIGDSFSDIGNQKDIIELLDLEPAGFPFDPPFFNGRLSDGPVWIEMVASNYGIPLDNAIPFGDPIDGQNNFAQAGAPTFNDGSVPSLPLGMVQQANYFVSNLAAYSSVDPATTLFVILGGGNDTFLLSTTPTPQQIINQAQISVNNILNIINQLDSIGGTQFLIGNFPNISLAEMYAFDILTIPQIGEDFSIAFNSRLAQALEALRQSRPDLNLIEVDIAAVSQAVRDNPSNFGITNIAEPCVIFGAGSTLESVCDNPEEFLNFDSFHPSTTVHDLWGQAALDALAPASSPDASAVQVPNPIYLYWALSALFAAIGIRALKIKFY